MIRPILFALAAATGLGAQAASALPVTDFTGDYAFSNFSVTRYGALGCASGLVVVNGAQSVDIGGCNDDTGEAAWISFTAASQDAGYVNFSYDLRNFDAEGPGWDFFYITLNHLEHNLGGADATDAGPISFAVAPGDVFGWMVHAVDDIAGPLAATIKGFSVTSAPTGAVASGFADLAPNPVPVPGALGLLAMGLAGLAAAARRQRARRAAA
ncbi:hypothetical protein [Oceanicella actignis]|uniref:PEP-CTERM protein-sorting domain-containing protein n=1 Tax=Oceanicella actignis TaxID=1189325 RepID=A0A1M7TKF0_9RHOB|nr:hypothetical protein [Oceanicella actignis]SET67864.1 PEP-CTERM protein-sorting domain-containing protein [Oceanicella actignis]SHN71128.1 PEP-CTERM protein-sorting domain-containing protein [Oceanicella actignis]